MSATSISVPLINDNDTNFRGWGKPISDQMLAGGWVQTADTGQVNWASVTAPVGTNAVQGYEIWRSNDATGGMVEIYVKLEYGSGSATNNPSVWVTVGWGSNGSGTITGTYIGTRKQLTFTANGSNSPSYLAVGGGWFVFVLGNVNTCAMMFSVERTVASVSPVAFNNEIMFTYNNNNAWGAQVVEKDIASYPAQATNLWLMPLSTNSVINGIAGTALIVGQRAGFTAPSLNLTGCCNGDLGVAGTTVSQTTYGVSHTYMINANIASLNVGGTSNYQLLSRYE